MTNNLFAATFLQINVLVRATIDLFTVFSTFDMHKLGKICQHHWKEHLKISKIAIFESDTSKASQVVKN